MLKMILLLSVLGISNNAVAEPAEFNLSDNILTIPQVKVGSISVYNAKLLFDGNKNFELKSFDTSLTANNDIPPTENAAAIEQWLAKEIYKKWACETSSHPGTGSSPHGNVRVYSNPLLSATTGGPFPVGAASVKELYNGDQVTGYALGVKVNAGEGKGKWYWYERSGSSTFAEKIDAEPCESCHAKANNDRVFIHVK